MRSLFLASIYKFQARQRNFYPKNIYIFSNTVLLGWTWKFDRDFKKIIPNFERVSSDSVA